MFPSQIIFTRQLDSVSAHLEFLKIEQDVLKAGARLGVAQSHLEQTLIDFTSAAQRSAPKRFTHTWAVVELYGSIEQFVEGLVRDYLLKVQSIVPHFEQLPNEITKSHTRKSFELLQNVERLSLSIQERDVIANLHACGTATMPYKLNHDAYCVHHANLRGELMRSLFADVGILDICRRAYHTDGYQAYLASMDHPGGTLHGRRPGAEFPQLDELIEFRNEAAHGVPSDFLSLDLLTQYVAFARALGSALSGIVDEATRILAIKHHGKNAGELIDVYRSEIVCLWLAHATRVGDVIAAETPDGHLRWGPIQEIQIDGTQIQEAAAGERAALRVSFHAKRNQRFLLLPSGWQDLE